MKTYNKKCPLCGHMNKKLYLKGTNGWMECEHCHQDIQFRSFEKTVKIPVYSMEGLLETFGTVGTY